MAQQAQVYMPIQLLNESREYYKCLDLIFRYLKNGNGNIMLRKGPHVEIPNKPQPVAKPKLGTKKEEAAPV